MLIDTEEALEVKIRGEALLFGDRVDAGPVRGQSRRQAVALDVFQPAANDLEGLLFELLLDAMPLNEDGLGARFAQESISLFIVLGDPWGWAIQVASLPPEARYLLKIRIHSVVGGAATAVTPKAAASSRTSRIRPSL